MESSVKLLIIDDEEIVHKSCKRILKKELFKVDYAYSGEEGLELVNKNFYHIIITDLMMPGIGGMEVLKFLTKNRPDITAVVFTGYATVDSVREAMKLGAFDYIPKPFTPDEFRDVLRNAVVARTENGESQALDLMAIVSHELRSPVAVVHSSADTLLKGYFGKLEPAQRSAMEAIIRNCIYLEDIIRSFLDLDKMDLENMDSFFQKVEIVSDVLIPVLNKSEVKGNFKKMALALDHQVNPILEADPNLLKIVITNLVSNAVKYGYPDGDIRITVTEDTENCLISIWNEGVGFTQEEAVEKLFKRNSRLKQKGTEGVKGNGLGLYICKLIIEKHGGTIEARSEIGKWSEFMISLPKTDESDAAIVNS